MPDFETILQFLVLFGGFMGVIVAAGFGFKRLGARKPEEPALREQLAGMQARLAELEERVDFAERTLADARSREQLRP